LPHGDNRGERPRSRQQKKGKTIAPDEHGVGAKERVRHVTALIAIRFQHYRNEQRASDNHSRLHQCDDGNGPITRLSHPTGGFIEDGKLRFDFHSFPLRITEVAGHPHQGVLQVGYSDSIFTRSKGGVTPSGWSCEHLPYVVEFDNFGRSREPGKTGKAPFIWGWDEITWFALQPEAERNDWLRYAWNWVKNTDPVGHLQMPGSRVITPGTPGAARWYWANIRSDACPEGSNTEQTIKEIWAGAGSAK
jgi:hypothetical protein